MSGDRPTLADDLYTDAAILEPFPLYRRIRDLAPAVWLDAHRVWALGRFEDVRAALRADGVLVSGRGVALNDAVNQLATVTTLSEVASDRACSPPLSSARARPSRASARAGPGMPGTASAAS